MGAPRQYITMIEFFEDKGTWAGLPISIQGIFEDNTCITIKIIDRSTGEPMSWAFGKDKRAGNPTEGFMKILQALYDADRRKQHRESRCCGIR